ncbi:MAG TPA: alkaline phosphatase, partial [Steroidobacteraceae bacterium]|nr:alkaline phosphatase [Steroidobacteraceae bacterium]
MNKRSVGKLCAALMGVSLLIGSVVAHDRHHGKRHRLPPRNLILIIGDGMDDQQITIARNYLVGAFGRLNLDRYPTRGTVQVLTSEEEAPHSVAYVADSANGASSLAAGIITSTGRISTTVGDDRDAPSIFELAKAAGYRTGVVTTSAVTDATPAAFVAHVASRSCQGPVDTGACGVDLKANGGPGSIAEQIAEGNVDVVMGGGAAQFNQSIGGGRTVLQLAQDNGFQLVNTPATLDAFDGHRMLGLFSASHMPVKLLGAAGARLTFDATNNPIFPAPINCARNSVYTNGTMPALIDMVDKAIEVLSKDNRRGFVLVVESSSIDKQAHARNPCGHIGELEQLDEVAGLVRDVADDHLGTLVLVTADHGQSAQLLPETFILTPPAGAPAFASLGYVARVNTLEG